MIAACACACACACAGDFGAEDWEQALGGAHAWVEDPGGEVVAHGSLVPRCGSGTDCPRSVTSRLWCAPTGSGAGSGA